MAASAACDGAWAARPAVARASRPGRARAPGTWFFIGDQRSLAGWSSMVPPSALIKAESHETVKPYTYLLKQNPPEYTLESISGADLRCNLMRFCINLVLFDTPPRLADPDLTRAARPCRRGPSQARPWQRARRPGISAHRGGVVACQIFDLARAP